MLHGSWNNYTTQIFSRVSGNNKKPHIGGDQSIVSYHYFRNGTIVHPHDETGLTFSSPRGINQSDVYLPINHCAFRDWLVFLSNQSFLNSDNYFHLPTAANCFHIRPCGKPNRRLCRFYTGVRWRPGNHVRGLSDGRALHIFRRKLSSVPTVMWTYVIDRANIGRMRAYGFTPQSPKLDHYELLWALSGLWPRITRQP